MANRKGARRRRASRVSSRGGRPAGPGLQGAAARRAGEPPRRDDAGQLWARAQVDAEVRAIVAELAHLRAEDVLLSTRFHDDLDWDGWFVLAVAKPIRKRLHEDLSDPVLLRLETVGDIADYVWARMEVVM